MTGQGSRAEPATDPQEDTLPAAVLSWSAWPALMIACSSITAYGFARDQPLLWFNVAYAFLAACLLILEYAMPHERSWQKPDGQTFANIAHTLTSKGTVQGLVLFGGVIGLSEVITPLSGDAAGIWPREWPMAAQVVLGLVAAEFMLYWAHRAGHEFDLLWRFHAVHHSVTRLWIINTGRFHFFDSLFSIAMGVTLLILLGAPLEAVQWLSALTAFIGMLTHCNVRMRFGPISYVFNTPGLHRWHHSRDLREGNRNYGENLMLWDMVFGTWYNPDRRPPANIGIDDVMPERFVDQLLYPFRRSHYRKQAGRDVS